MLDKLIQNLKEKLLSESSLEAFCYYFINEQQNQLHQLDRSLFTGEAEQIAILGYLGNYADKQALRNISRRLDNLIYAKHLTIYHFLGLTLQDNLNKSKKFEDYVEERFKNQSFRYKYLIAKVFNRFEQDFKIYLQTQIELQDHFLLTLKYLYLESEIDKRKIIQDFKTATDRLDLIDLILLEDLQNIEAIGYNRIQEQLFKDIQWIAIEIQNNHRNLNNSEDQYNSLFRSLINSKEYIATDQTQRGTSFSKKQAGELDIMVSSKEKIPISIIEAFKLNSITKATITDHLKKLSENYDPNGLRYNYAIIYSGSKNFSGLWKRYNAFVPTINFKHKAINFSDITSRFPQVSGIKVGLTSHKNRGGIVKIYHIFMDMNF